MNKERLLEIAEEFELAAQDISSEVKISIMPIEGVIKGIGTKGFYINAEFEVDPSEVERDLILEEMLDNTIKS